MWVGHYEAFKVFSDELLPIVSCQEAIIGSSAMEKNQIPELMLNLFS